MRKLLPIILLFVFVISCKDEDPCDGITCMNDGVCINGQCDCPENYEGADCSDQKTPSKMFITKIVITKFPATEGDGGGWDLSDGPDIFPYLYQGNTLIWESPNMAENADPSKEYEVTLATPIAISATAQYNIGLSDYDGIDAADFMGGVTFVPYSDTNGFPEERVLDPDGGSVAFKISLRYEF